METLIERQGGGVAERRSRAQSRLGAGALRRSARRSRDEARDGGARSRSHGGLPTGRGLRRGGAAGAPRPGALRAGPAARDPRRPALRRARPAGRGRLARSGRPPAALRHHRAAGRRATTATSASSASASWSWPSRSRGARSPAPRSERATTGHRACTVPTSRPYRRGHDRDRGRADPEVTAASAGHHPRLALAIGRRRIAEVHYHCAPGQTRRAVERAVANVKAGQWIAITEAVPR